jgi:hypothetical protein
MDKITVTKEAIKATTSLFVFCIAKATMATNAFNQHGIKYCMQGLTTCKMWSRRTKSQRLPPCKAWLHASPATRNENIAAMQSLQLETKTLPSCKLCNSKHVA